MRRKTAGATATVIAIAGVCILLVTGSSASAQGIGVRAGVSGDPDQFYAGVHGETGPIVDRLFFRPSLEMGFGNETTLMAGNVEFAYRIPFPGSLWRLNLGGGPALIVARRRGNTDSGGGLNVLVGVEHSQGFFTELKVGAIDSPGVKFGVGYAFRP
jgi:hypothetical protein